MFGNIKKNNVRCLDLKMNNDKFYDFMLYKGETYGYGKSNLCVVSSFDSKNISDSGEWVSETKWENAVNNNVELKNIGLTGIDNGQIVFQKDRIGDSEFLKIFTESSLLLNDEYFRLNKVSGNSKQYIYPVEKNEDFVALKGGFFQGFYKVEGRDYQVLPNDLNSDWIFEIVLRKKEYDILDKTLNKKYPQNKDIFFYIGTRAENKFARYYNGGEEVWCDNITENAFPEGFINTESSLKNVDVMTDDGFNINTYGEFDIKTDNKHIFFNRTKTGFTVDTWDESYDVYIRDNKRKNDNIFEIANRAKTGFTVDDIDEMLESNDGYDIYQDIKENAFALKINDDGSITYRYAITDCESENKFKIKEETTKEGIINNDEWCTIHVRFLKLSNNKMKMSLYVNGNLIFVSQEMPLFNFRGLNDVSSKQETVPYNISIGGGTQGLIDGIWKDWYCKHDNIVSPLVDNFGGTFIGDIKSFKFYDCFLSYSDINDNVFKDI